MCHSLSLVVLSFSSANSVYWSQVSCIGLRLTNGKIWLFDCGEGTQHQIGKCSHIKPGKVSCIFITHLHGDHSFGLPGLLASLSLLAGSPEKTIKVFGPIGVKQLIETSLSLSSTYLTYELIINELDATQSHNLGVIDGLSVVACPLKHKVPSLGYVVKEPDKPMQLDSEKAMQLGASGKLLGQLKAGKDVTLSNGTIIRAADVLMPGPKGKVAVILGDTCDSTLVLNEGSGCHYLVHECTYDASLRQKAIEGGHSTSEMAGEFAAQLKAKNLILTHFSQRYDSGQEGDLTIADLVEEARRKCPETNVYAAEDFSNFEF